MLTYRINFAYHADPNGQNSTDLPAWPEYGGENNMIRLDIEKIEVIPDTYREKQIDFLLEDPVVFDY